MSKSEPSEAFRRAAARIRIVTSGTPAELAALGQELGLKSPADGGEAGGAKQPWKDDERLWNHRRVFRIGFCDGDICPLCGKPMYDKPLALHLDHIIPIARWPSVSEDQASPFDPTNEAWLHTRCNLQKATRIVASDRQTRRWFYVEGSA